WTSDALCRLSTGGGFSTRELYSDSDEKIFDSMRPVILNGIGDIVTMPDLLDRCIVLQLPIIPEHKRRQESELNQQPTAAVQKLSSPKVQSFLNARITHGPSPSGSCFQTRRRRRKNRRQSRPLSLRPTLNFDVAFH